MAAMGGYETGTTGTVSPSTVKFAQAIAKLQPPPSFAAALRVDPGSAPRIETHFGDIVMSIEKVNSGGMEQERLAGFWKADENGNLTAAPEEAIPELLESASFMTHLAETLIMRKHALFERMVKASLMPNDKQTYSSDKERKKTFLFNLGDGREIVVFANESKSELLRAAIIKSGPFGMKDIKPLPVDLYGSLFEHDSISNVLEIMAAAKPVDGAAYPMQQTAMQPTQYGGAPSPYTYTPPKIPGAQYTPPQAQPEMTSPRPQIPPRVPQSIQSAMPRPPNMPFSQKKTPDEELEIQDDETAAAKPPAVGAGGMKPPLQSILKVQEKHAEEEDEFVKEIEERINNKRKGEAALLAASKAKKGKEIQISNVKGKKAKVMKGKQAQPDAADEEEVEMPSEDAGEEMPKKPDFKKTTVPRGNIDNEIGSMNPYDAQQKIISMLEELHMQRVDADNAREKAVKQLNGRMNTLERAIKAYDSELAEYEMGFNRRKENLESALRGWEKYGSEITEYKKRVDELTETTAEISAGVSKLEMPSEKEAAWAQGLADSLATLKEVSNRLAEAERKHKEDVEKMSDQLQRSISKSIGGAKKKGGRE